MVNTIVVDVLATQVARTSTTMVLTELSRNIPVAYIPLPLHWYPVVLNPQYHALINPVWDLYVFARMISATTGPYRSCTGSVWVCLNLQQGGSHKRRENTEEDDWLQLCNN